MYNNIIFLMFFLLLVSCSCNKNWQDDCMRNYSEDFETLAKCKKRMKDIEMEKLENIEYKNF